LGVGVAKQDRENERSVGRVGRSVGRLVARRKRSGSGGAGRVFSLARAVCAAVVATTTTAAAAAASSSARLIGETVPATGGTVSQRRCTGRTGQGRTLTLLSVLSSCFLLLLPFASFALFCSAACD